MKKLAVLLALMFVTSLAFTQVNTISFPNGKTSVTPEWIKTNGQAYQHSGERSIIDLTFEGLGDEDQILSYYTGGLSSQGFGPGPNYGIYFNSAALSIIGQGAGGTGNFNNNPSGVTIMFFLEGDASVMNVPAGFTTGFSYYYASYYESTVFVYDDVDGTGNLLATQTFPANIPASDCPPNSYTYCHWDPVGVSFSGTAKSVAFTGVANYCGFDDVTFGSSTPGPQPVPISNWALFIAIGLIVVATVVRFRRLI
jgi:hypothetical protein